MSNHYQRRKGNAKSASSAQAAELLANSGYTVPLVTFDDHEPSFTATILEKQDSEDESFNPEIHIALKKITKKDALTREKGLKDLIRLIDEASMDDSRKSFKHFVAVFPKLALDGTVAVRSNAVRVLQSYIKSLQKSSERYLKKVLPYVVFLMHDSYAQIANGSKTMLTDCFPKEKYFVAMDICKEPICELSLQLLNGTHPLLRKGEGEETEEQRYVRLTSQSLQCLQRACTESLSEENRQQLLQLFSRASLKRLFSLSPQVVGGILNLASCFVEATGDWDGVIEGGIPSAALTRLDDVDRGVCRAAAYLILQMANSKKLFGALDIDKAVVPRLISLIRRKENHWNHISTILMPLIEALIMEKTETDGRQLLLRILDTFLDGMPWDQSFPLVIWVNTFGRFIEFGSRWAVDRCTNDRDALMDDFLAKILMAMKCSLKWSDRFLMYRLARLTEQIINTCADYPETVDRLFVHMQEYLLNGLPSTEPLIEELLCEEITPVWANFVERLLKNAFSSQNLTAELLEKCSSEVLEEINAQSPLCQIIANKIDWNESEDVALQMLKLLIKFAAMFYERITKYYKFDDELSSIRFLIAYGQVNEKERQLTASFVEDGQVLAKAMRYCVKQVDMEHWKVLINIGKSFPSFETDLDAMLKEYGDKMDLQLLLLMLGEQSTYIYESLRNKLIEVMLGQFFGTVEPSLEFIQEMVGAMTTSNTNMKFVAHIIISKINSPNLPQYGIHLATTMAILLPPQFIKHIVISCTDLFEKFAALDEKYGLGIIDAMEFLLSPTAVKTLTVCKEEKNSTDCLLSHLNYAMFIANYFVAAPNDCVDRSAAVFVHAHAESTATLLYVIAVSSLASLNTVISEDLIDVRKSLSNLVNNEILNNKRLRENLLSRSISLIADGNHSLCMLLAMRRLADCIRTGRIEALFRDSAKELNDLGFALCSLALRLQDPGIASEKFYNYWTRRFEIASSSKESAGILQPLVEFQRLPRDDYLFCYSNDGTEEDAERNAFNCAFLRYLRRCCAFLSQMNNDKRDMLCCAMITSLESAVSLWKECKLRSYTLFVTMSVKLFNECSRVIGTTTNDVELAPFRQEWSDFFFPTAQKILLMCFLGLASTAEQGDPCAAKSLQNAICLSMNYITDECVRTASLPRLFDAELDQLNYDEDLQSVVIPLQTLIGSSSVNIQLAALKILKLITGDMLRTGNKKCGNGNDGGEEKLLAVPEGKQLPIPFKRILNDTSRGGGVIPSKLLIWDAFITSLNTFELQEKMSYCNAMSQYTDQILPALFCELHDGYLDTSGALEPVDITKPEYWEEINSAVPRYAFRLFYVTCSALPATVRQWYMKLPRSAISVFSTYVTRFVSPLLWKAECDQFASYKMPNKLKVRLLRAARQIVAEYDLEDSVMVLTIEYPADYPLSIPVISNEKAIVNKETRRKWLLQLTMFLTHQNGSVVGAVLMWANNVEKHMEGSEDCTICMMTVHSNTYQLPRVRCKQCKKRFHSACLFKWFDSSQQSTCPLCRASFR